MSPVRAQSLHEKLQTALGCQLSMHPQHCVISPSISEPLSVDARYVELVYDGIGCGEHVKINLSLPAVEYNDPFIIEEPVSFPDPKSRPCQMQIVKRTPNTVLLKANRLPGQNDTGMEIYIPIGLEMCKVGSTVQCYVAFPEFEGTTLTLTTGHQVRYNHRTYEYEMKLYPNEAWYPMDPNFTLTQREWKMLADLKNER